MEATRNSRLASGRVERITRRGFIVSGLALVATASVGRSVAAAAPDMPPTGNGQGRFKLNVNGVTIATFDELKGISSEVEPIELLESDDQNTFTHSTKLVGRNKPLTVTLSRGRTKSLVLWRWHEQAQTDGATARRDAKLVLMDEDGAVVKKYRLVNAWPSKVEISGMKAGSSDQVFETVTLVAERIEDDG